MYRDKGIRYKDKRLTVQVKDRYTDIGYKDARMQETGCRRQETGGRMQEEIFRIIGGRKDCDPTLITLWVFL